MSGVKGKSGGARVGSGAPVRRIQLDKSTATVLRILILNLRSSGSTITENQFVANLIHEKWIEYDNSIQKAVEEMEEFV